jgi:sugar lactone lactonase YvrE
MDRRARVAKESPGDDVRWIGPKTQEVDVRGMRGAAPAAVLTCVWTGGVAGQGLPVDSVSTVFVSDTIEGFGAVGGVAVDGLGYVYVADFRNAVWRLSPDGELIRFADGLYGASGNAIGPRGYLYQSSFNGNYVSRISRTGEVETYVAEGLTGPVGIAASPKGDLFVVNCNGGTVSRVDTERRVTEFARSELLACPNGITFDDRGDLFVVNFNNTKVVRITPDGTATEFADIGGAGGNGHIAFAAGVFYVTKFRGNQLFRLYRDGSFEVLAGTGQPGTSDGAALEATFTQPNGVGASPSGTFLWVNDLTRRGAPGVGPNLVSMRRIRLVSLTDALATVEAGAPAEAVQSAYAAYRSSRPRERTVSSAIAVAYQWLSAGRIAQALELFALNAASYPDDPAAVFARAEGFRYTGQAEAAAEQSRRVLALQPDHPTAGARLAEVGGGREDSPPR